VPAVLSSPVPTSAVTPPATVPSSTTVTSTARALSNIAESVSGWLQIGAIVALSVVVGLLVVVVAFQSRRIKALELKQGNT